jgi:hypothetical protein
VREALAERNAAQGGEIELAIDVGVHQDERPFAEQRSSMRDSAGGLERLALAGIGDAKAVALACADAPDDALGEMRDVDHRLAIAGRGEPLEVPGDERLAARLHHGLGDRIRERPQALATSCRKNHYSHPSSSSSRFRGPSAE